MSAARPDSKNDIEGGGKHFEDAAPKWQTRHRERNDRRPACSHLHLHLHLHFLPRSRAGHENGTRRTIEEALGPWTLDSCTVPIGRCAWRADSDIRIASAAEKCWRTAMDGFSGSWQTA
jgi:hypothetical protein